MNIDVYSELSTSLLDTARTLLLVLTKIVHVDGLQGSGIMRQRIEDAREAIEKAKRNLADWRPL